MSKALKKPAEPQTGARWNHEKLGHEKWTDRTGKKIPYHSIDIGYLRNIVRFCERTVDKMRESRSAGWSMLGYITGEMAMDSIERGLDTLEDQIAQAEIHLDFLRDYLAWREQNNFIFGYKGKKP